MHACSNEFTCSVLWYVTKHLIWHLFLLWGIFKNSNQSLSARVQRANATSRQKGLEIEIAWLLGGSHETRTSTGNICACDVIMKTVYWRAFYEKSPVKTLNFAVSESGGQHLQCRVTKQVKRLKENSKRDTQSYKTWWSKAPRQRYQVWWWRFPVYTA